MKVAKQAQGDLLRGADAGRNGYETGMYDAFLACVQASVRGVKLPPFTVGERLKVSGPMQVWKRTVGKLPFVGVDEAVIALPDVDAAEPCPVVVLTPVVGADSMECVEVDQDLQGGGDADQQSLDDSVATMRVDAVGVVGKVDQRAPTAVGGTNSGGLVDLSLDMSWLNDGLGQMEGWGRLVEIHGQRLAKATSEQFESARLLPVLCFMARALGEHAVLGNTVGSEGQGASFEQRDAEPSSGELDFGGVDPLDVPFGFEGIARDGFQVVGQQSFVTTERVLRYAVDGLESNQVKYINLRRSVNSLLHDAAVLGWLEQRSVKLEGGPRVNIWTFLPEGIEYVGIALLARENTARVSRGIPMARICSELSVEEREERREVLKARRESLAKRGVPASGTGKKSVVTRKELADSLSQGAIDKQRSRVQAAGASMWAGLFAA